MLNRFVEVVYCIILMVVIEDDALLAETKESFADISLCVMLKLSCTYVCIEEKITKSLVGFVLASLHVHTCVNLACKFACTCICLVRE